jgi:hypothetical protein
MNGHPYRAPARPRAPRAPWFVRYAAPLGILIGAAVFAAIVWCDRRYGDGTTLVVARGPVGSVAACRPNAR